MNLPRRPCEMNLQACASKPRAGARLAAEEFLHAGGATADVGIILGTGLGSLVDRLTQQRTMPSTIGAWIPQSTALGHVGKIVSGSINGKQVVCLQGRVHAYEGFSHEMLGRGVEVLAALGVKKLLVTNASGGLATNLSRGDVIVMQEHLNFVHRGRFAYNDCQPELISDRMPSLPGENYHSTLREVAIATLRNVGASGRLGTYAYVLGPSYETRAEYRWLRRVADVVGMSTVPEVVTARRLGIHVLGLSVVTNISKPDLPPDKQIVTDSNSVLLASAGSAQTIWKIFEQVTGMPFEAIHPKPSL